MFLPTQEYFQDQSNVIFYNTEKIIHAFISSCQDYSNALFTCLRTVVHLQTLQNSPARLLTKNKRSSHITPVLASLQWLPISFRIHFKSFLTIYKALHRQAPEYISELLIPYGPKRPLRSAGLVLLAIPESKPLAQAPA